MLRSFTFAALPEIIFSPGSLQQLPDMLSSKKEPFLLLTGKTSFRESAKGKEFLDALSSKDLNFYAESVDHEPSPEIIDFISGKYRNAKLSLVLAIGGGSVLDAGKAVAAMLTEKGSVKDYLEGVGIKDPSGSTLPFIAVPTTSGTGSEATKNAVISQTGAGGFKKSLRHNNFIPTLALLDPELSLECPDKITASSGMDCFSQLTEAFLSDKASEYTDAFAVAGLKAIGSSLQAAYEDGSDLHARTEMAFASLNSGICLANAGLGTVHGFASSVGGRLEIPHGIVCGSLMPVSNKLTVKALREGRGEPEALKKYVQLGKIFLDEENKSDDYYIDGFVDYLYMLKNELHIPSLTHYGIPENTAIEIVENTGNKNNPVNLNADELIQILLEN